MAKTARWVQYEAQVFVRVEVDENGWDTEITKVVHRERRRGAAAGARRPRGFRVYDEQFQPVEEDEVLDGIRGAVSIAEDRHRWPDRAYTRRGMTAARPTLVRRRSRRRGPGRSVGSHRELPTVGQSIPRGAQHAE
jgi:hypothetical protein